MKTTTSLALIAATVLLVLPMANAVAQDLNSDPNFIKFKNMMSATGNKDIYVKGKVDALARLKNSDAPFIFRGESQADFAISMSMRDGSFVHIELGTAANQLSYQDAVAIVVSKKEFVKKTGDELCQTLFEKIITNPLNKDIYLQVDNPNDSRGEAENYLKGKPPFVFRKGSQGFAFSILTGKDAKTGDYLFAHLVLVTAKDPKPEIAQTQITYQEAFAIVGNKKALANRTGKDLRDLILAGALSFYSEITKPANKDIYLDGSKTVAQFLAAKIGTKFVFRLGSNNKYVLSISTGPGSVAEYELVTAKSTVPDKAKLQLTYKEAFAMVRNKNALTPSDVVNDHIVAGNVSIYSEIEGFGSFNRYVRNLGQARTYLDDPAKTDNAPLLWSNGPKYFLSEKQKAWLKGTLKVTYSTQEIGLQGNGTSVISWDDAQKALMKNK